MTTPRRLLIVSPGFHGYWSAVAAAFESLGLEVRVHRYDEHQSTSHRIQNKLMHDLPDSFQWKTAEELTTRKSVAKLREWAPDAVVVVKGDQLGAQFWDVLTGMGIPRITWLYDEIRRTRYTHETLAQVGPIASYSRLDVAELEGLGLAASHVPLGFDSLLNFSPVVSGAVTLVGARYTSRESLLQAMQARGTSVRAYGREWSRNVWDIARTRRLRSPGIPTGGDVKRDIAYGMMAGSLATLNVHGDQDGFTMRTFEAAGVGGLQLVDRSDVAEFYDPGEEVLVFGSADEATQHADRARVEPDWARGIREAARVRTSAHHTLVHRAETLVNSWG